MGVPYLVDKVMSDHRLSRTPIITLANKQDLPVSTLVSTLLSPFSSRAKYFQTVKLINHLSLITCWFCSYLSFIHKNAMSPGDLAMNFYHDRESHVSGQKAGNSSVHGVSAITG